MPDIEIPVNPTHGIPEIHTELPVGAQPVPAMARPRENEPAPFHAGRAPEWLIAYA